MILEKAPRSGNLRSRARLSTLSPPLPRSPTRGAPVVPNNDIRVGNVEIMSLSDGMLEFDLCNFFPTIPEDSWQGHESDLTEEHKVRFNLGSFLIRSQGRTILVDTGLGPKPADAPDVPWGQLMRYFQDNRVRPGGVDMVVVTQRHRAPAGGNLTLEGAPYVPRLS